MIPPCNTSIEFTEIVHDRASANFWRTTSVAGMLHVRFYYISIQVLQLQQTTKFLNAWVDQCNGNWTLQFNCNCSYSATLSHPGLLDSLRKEKFDVAITEPMDLCGIGKKIYHKGSLNVRNQESSTISGSRKWLRPSLSLPSKEHSIWLDFLLLPAMFRVRFWHSFCQNES